MKNGKMSDGLIPLDEWVKKFASQAEAARALGFDWQRVHAYLERKHFADRAHRELAAIKGVALPVRPR